MSEMSYYDQVKEAADAIRARVPTLPEIAIVLGSGLGDFANSLGGATTMPYAELPHWPASRVIGHSGKLVVGTVARPDDRRAGGPLLTCTRGTTSAGSPFRCACSGCWASRR